MRVGLRWRWIVVDWYMFDCYGWSLVVGDSGGWCVGGSKGGDYLDYF